MSDRLQKLLRVTALATFALSIGLLSNPQGPHAASAPPKPVIAHFGDVEKEKFMVFASGVSFAGVAMTPEAGFGVLHLASVKRHRHLHSTEYMYVVSGTGTAWVGAMKKTIGPGDMIFIPQDVPHAFSASGAPFKLVMVESPPITPDDMHYMP